MSSEAYIKEPSKRTPGIYIRPGNVIIMGRSIPDNPAEFYGSVMDQISGYMNKYQGKTVIKLGFDYINTSSTKWILVILRKLSGMSDIQQDISVTWFYEEGDDDMHELGHILGSFTDCPFLITGVSNIEITINQSIRTFEH